jgi:hypothetical protein
VGHVLTASKASTVASGTPLVDSKGTAPSTAAKVMMLGSRLCSWVALLYKMYLFFAGPLRHCERKAAGFVRVGLVTFSVLLSLWSRNREDRGTAFKGKSPSVALVKQIRRRRARPIKQPRTDTDGKHF